MEKKAKTKYNFFPEVAVRVEYVSFGYENGYIISEEILKVMLVALPNRVVTVGY